MMDKAHTSSHCHSPATGICRAYPLTNRSPGGVPLRRWVSQKPAHRCLLLKRVACRWMYAAAAAAVVVVVAGNRSFPAAILHPWTLFHELFFPKVVVRQN